MSTLSYYSSNFKEYYENTINANLTNQLKIFKSMLNGVDILDAGCGSGRDTLEFRNNGFNAVGFDCCKEMIDYLTVELKHSTDIFSVSSFDDFKSNIKFDGIICNASLLHLPKKDFKQNLINLLKNLKNDGIIFITLKEGSGESFDNLNRYFSYYTIPEVIEIFHDLGLTTLYTKKTEDILGRKDCNWLNFIFLK